MKPGMQRDLLVTFWLLFDEIRDEDEQSAAGPGPAASGMPPEAPTGPPRSRDPRDS